ncbi:MAG: tetratricopeptide repeat protein, partial [Burkholderiaceae bacterium]
MITDRYENPISTESKAAADFYISGLDQLLAGGANITESFEAAINADPDFVLAYCGLARVQQVTGNPVDARVTMDKANEVASKSGGLSARESAHVQAMTLLTSGKVGPGYQLIREHLAAYPRDAMLAQTCTSVFGLIGFSGRPGREAELLAYTESLLPHYGDDWWFLCQHAFSLCETGQLDRAAAMIDKSLAINPGSAHGAHIRAHVYYEQGDITDGADYLDQWMPGYEKRAYLHCHLSWHIALWALEQGKSQKLWETVNNSVMPDGAWGPPLNVLTDAAAILYRAELAGEAVPAGHWKTLSDYSTQYFPVPGLAFADVHA